MVVYDSPQLQVIILPLVVQTIEKGECYDFVQSQRRPTDDCKHG